MKIHFNDELSRIEDKLSCNDKRIRGRVKVFESDDEGKLSPIIDTNNLIVYQGRKWLLQRAFYQTMTGFQPEDKDSFISWFGLGTGGTGANLLIPLAPTVNDTDLNTPATINPTDPIVVNSGKLHPFDSITFQADPTHDNQTLIATITTTISKTDANGPANGSGPSDYYDLSEAGLYVSNSTDPNLFDPATAKIFARVTFSTIRKSSSRSLVFIWYIYF